MTGPWLLLAAFAWLAAWLAAGARWPNRVPLPGIGWLLDHAGVPRWMRPRTGKENPCARTPAASTATTTMTRSTTTRAAKAATTADFAVPRGRHHAGEPLIVRFSVGGERADGTWAHSGTTGPMPVLGDFSALPDTPIDYWPSLLGRARQRQRTAVTADDIGPVFVPEVTW